MSSVWDAVYNPEPSELETKVTSYEARIAELEAACEKAEYELDWHSDELRKLEKEEQLFHNTLDAQQMIIEELRAENQRLRNSLADIALKLAGMLRGVK